MVEEEKKGEEAPGHEVGTMKTGDYMIHVSIHNHHRRRDWIDKREACCRAGLHNEWQELEV